MDNVVDAFVNTLNDALLRDPIAINSIFRNRSPVNDALLLSGNPITIMNDNTMSAIGLINGVLESLGATKKIAMVSDTVDATENIMEFVVTRKL